MVAIPQSIADAIDNMIARSAAGERIAQSEIEDVLCACYACGCPLPAEPPELELVDA